MISFKSCLRTLNLFNDRRKIESALALHRRGEVRRDGLTLIQSSHRLEIEWRARDIHPWDRGCDAAERELLFSEQSLADTDAAIARLFRKLPEIDVIAFKVLRPDSGDRILAGTVERSAARAPKIRNPSPRTRLWYRGVTMTPCAIVAFTSSQEPAVSEHQLL